MRSVLEVAAPIEKIARLPVGRVPLLAFVADAQTEKALHECLSQLAFAHGDIMRGGIAKAIEFLSEQRSPTILVVDVSGVDLPISRMHALAEVCEPGVTVIAIGDRNDVGLYRDLHQAGVADYIVKPLTAQHLGKALTARTNAGEASPIHKKLGTVVAFVGARGGVGTTTLAVNLAWHLANRQSRRVALVDLDLQNGDCALALNIAATSGLRDALVNPLRLDNTLLERVMTPVGERLFVLSSEEPLSDDVRFTADAVEALVSALRDQFHYVIVDVPRLPWPPYRRALDLADFRIMVADQTLRSVRDTMRLRTSLGDDDGKHRNLLVVNRHGEGGRRAVTLKEMHHVLDLRPNSVIPFQPTLFTAVAGEARVAAARSGKFTDAIAALVVELSGATTRAAPLVEVREMISSGFGRRVIEPGGRELVLVPNRQNTGPIADLADRDELKEGIRTALMSRIDPSVAGRISRPTLRTEVAKIVSEIASEQRVQLNELEESALATELTDDMIGLGPLEPFLDDDEITDILANGPFDVYVERRGKLEKTAARFRDAQHLVNIAQRIATAIGRRIDEASPMVDARLADGSRVNIVLPPLVLNGGTISIRKFPKRALTIDTMVRQENLSHDMARVLQIAARSRVNMLISGGTGSGKTTLLNAVSRFIDDDERVITIEDAVELRLEQPHIVQMETRPPNIEGVGHIPQRELVRNALRMRPDRIIVGEVRGPEAFDMLQAMNTGHDGSMSTVHANTPRDALYRVENMVMMAVANLPLKAIRMHVASALNLIVHVERMRDGIRRVQSIAEIAGMEGEIITLRELFNFKHGGERRDGTIEGTYESTRMRPDFVARAARYGLDRELLDAVGITGG